MMPVLFKDGYKTDHRRQYPDLTQEVYSNLTARASRDPRYTATVVFGFQSFVSEFLVDRFERDFFAVRRDMAVVAYKRRLDHYLGKDAVPIEHIGQLHDSGVLPLEIKALPEGTLCPIGVPMLTIRNTKPEFFWLVNFLETLISSQTWKGITNATIGFEYRKMFEVAAARTNPEMQWFASWQAHDFSFRGMDGVDSACRSGAAHLLSNNGTDTIPAIDYIEEHYRANVENELIGGSVAATEHSVMCMGGEESEVETFRRLFKLYPTGILSVVSDTWDYWHVLTVILPQLKDEIMARDGKLVIRPDSGHPLKIVCGDPQAPDGSPEQIGSLRLLWATFGGTSTSKGYSQLDSHIGLIYGDSITLNLASDILTVMDSMGFASTNVVFGVGSYTYQFNTRDTFGMAIKATHGIVGGVGRDIHKNPKTDSGLKRSAKGYLRVNEDLTLDQECSVEHASGGLLRTIFRDGVQMNRESWDTVKGRLMAKLNG